MRIGYVVRYWPTLSETFIAREIDAVREVGIDVELVALGRRRDPAAGEGNGFVVDRPPTGAQSSDLAGPMWRILRRRLGRAVMASWLEALRPKDALRALWLADLARRRSWDRVHAHFAGEAAVWAAGAARLCRIPYSVTVHAADLFDPRPDLGALLRQAAPAITVSDHHRRWIMDRHGVSAVVVRCGVDPAAYPPATPATPRYPWVCVARDVPKKGLGDLVAATRSAGGLLRLVSDGVRHGGPGVLVGPLPANGVPRVLAWGGAFVLPCRVAPSGDRDGIPVALMEAMAAGLPVISTPVSGIPELVDDEVGWLAPPADPLGLAQVLADVRRHPGARAQRGAAARRRIRQHGWTVDRQAKQLAALWGAAVAP